MQGNTRLIDLRGDSLKKWLLIITCIVILGAGGWFIRFKQPVSILETLPENVAGSELTSAFVYGPYALNTSVLTEQQTQQLYQLLSEKNYRKQLLVDVNEMFDHVGLNLTFANDPQRIDFLIDTTKQEVFVSNGQKFHPFSIIDADELMAFADELMAFVEGLESKQE